MSKKFQAYLAEQDEEFTYNIKSSRHIHNDETFYNLQLGLLGYDLRSLERISYNPLAAYEPMFPPSHDEPGIDTVFHVKAVLGTEVPNEVLRQKIAYFTDIHWEWIAVYREGEKWEGNDPLNMADEEGGEYKNLTHTAKDWNGTPDDGDIDPDAQKYVGTARLADFMKELETDRKTREAEINDRNVTPKLYESFVTTHLCMHDMLGHTPRKGYYLLERYTVDPSVVHVSGPFKNKPMTHEFVSDLLKRGRGTFKVLDENKVKLEGHDRDFRYTKTLREQNLKNYEVMVKDQDTGRSYTALIKAFTETDARAKAVRRVAQKEKLDAGRLIAIEPEAA